MKTINKIAIVQVSFCVGGIIAYTLLDIELKKVIVNNMILTIGYLYGFWHSKN
jgi:hypothetical protein